MAVLSASGYANVISLRSIEISSGSVSAWPSGVRGRIRCPVGSMIPVIYHDAFGGEHASAGRAERIVRHPLLMQACRDENVIEDALLAHHPPRNAALDQIRGNGLQLIPALKATMGLNNEIKQIRHYFCPYRLAGSLRNASTSAANSA
jgi:hypothetical protein